MPELRLPSKVLDKVCARYKRDGKPTHRTELIHDSDFDIVNRYGAEYRGIVQYYVLAHNLRWLGRLRWYMGNSLLRTLARKHNTTTTKMARLYENSTVTSSGTMMKCFAVVIKREGKNPLIARFGGISLGHVRKATLIDERPIEATRIGGTELIQRLQANRCECCGSDKDVEVHHIRKLSDVNKPGRREKPLWQIAMSMRKRKTLVLCRSCHDDLHAGRPMAWST